MVVVLSVAALLNSISKWREATTKEKERLDRQAYESNHIQTCLNFQRRAEAKFAKMDKKIKRNRRREKESRRERRGRNETRKQ